MKKNILIIIHKLNGGGAERCASNLSIELSKLYNVYIACFDCRNMTYPYGGTLIDLSIANSSNSIQRGLNTIRRIKKLKQIKRKYKIECSISLLDGPNIANIFSKQNDKVIVSVRNCLSKEPMNFIRKKLVTLTSNKADKTVALSRAVQSDLEKNFNVKSDKLTTIYNHCDIELLRKLSLETPIIEGLYDSPFKYATMGRLTHQKGQWHLLRAFKKVLQTYPDSMLYIFGEGELESKLKKLASDLDICDSVYFTGYVKNPHSCISKCDCFVFPSLFEGLGNVLLEALSFNLPIISTDCNYGPREILAPDTPITYKCSEMEISDYGILIPDLDNTHFDSYSPLTNEEIMLAQAMILIQKNQELRMRLINNSKKRITAFDKKSIIMDWSKVIQMN